MRKKKVNIKTATDGIIRNLPKFGKFRIELTQGDSEIVEDSNNPEIKTFDDAIKYIVEKIAKENELDEEDKQKWIAFLKNGDRISSFEIDNITSETKEEKAENNEMFVENSLIDIFGNNNRMTMLDTINNFKQELIRNCYFVANKGVIIERTNENLNNNIDSMKQDLFEEMVLSLKDNFPNDSYVQSFDESLEFNEKHEITNLDNYFKVMTFVSKLTKKQEYKNKLNEEITSNKRDIFIKNRQKKLWDFYFKNTSESDRNTYRLTKEDFLVEQDDNTRSSRVIDILYDEIIKGNETLEEELDDIVFGAEGSFVSIFEKYSQLTYFDELVTNSVGDEIKINSSGNGYKYEYSQDISTQRTGWQDEEHNGANENTAIITKAFIGQIKLRDHRTHKLIGGKCDSGAYLREFLNLLNLIKSGELGIDSRKLPTLDYEKVMEHLKECAFRFHEKPNLYATKILNTIFHPEVSVSIKNKGIELNTLYSIYMMWFTT